MTEIKHSEVLNIFKAFSEKVDAKLKTPNKSDIATGGSIRYLTYEVEKVVNNSLVKISQTFSFIFSQPDELVAQTGLTLNVEKPTNSDFYLRFWTREFFDKLFSSNKVESGNPTFDKKFSARSSNPNIANSIFKNPDIQNLFLRNKFLVFNVNSNNKTLSIILKSMARKKYDLKEIEELYLNAIEIKKIIK